LKFLAENLVSLARFASNRQIAVGRLSSVVYSETVFMRLQATFGIGLLMIFQTTLRAELLYYEPFLTGSNPAAGEYTIGTLDPTINAGDGQNPTIGPTPFLAGPWESLNADAINGAVQAQGLSFLGAPSLGGSQISTPNSAVRRHLSAPWTETTQGIYYIGFLANFGTGDYTDGMDGNDMGYRSVEFYNSANAYLFGISYNAYNSPFGRLPNNAPMHLDGFGQFTQLEGAPASFAEDGLTHLIVLKFDLSTTATSDSLSIYLDPLTTEEPVIPNASIAGIDLTLGAIGGFTIYGGTGIGPVLDEMRVATTFIDALPDFPLLGDTNNDGEVDIDDYNVIIQNMNRFGVTISEGDLNGDGRVDLRDLRLWRDHRTDIPGGSTAGPGVPEPTGLALFAIGATLTASIRHRSKPPLHG
jgi:hypothetical protein